MFKQIPEIKSNSLYKQFQYLVQLKQIADYLSMENVKFKIRSFKLMRFKKNKKNFLILIIISKP